jgi:hypothetical protein
VSEQRIIAVVLGTPPDPLDPDICGDEIVVAKRVMKSAAAARKWVDAVLATPLPDGLLMRYGFMRRERWCDEDGGWWELVEESEPITDGERDSKTVWFPR